MDIVERLIVYRDRPGRSREGRDLLADACNEIMWLRRDATAVLTVCDWFTLAPKYRTKEKLIEMLTAKP